MSFILGLVRLEAEVAGADVFNADDIQMKVGNSIVLKEGNFNTGTVSTTFDDEVLAFNTASITASLTDLDVAPNPDDFIDSAILAPGANDPIGVRVLHTAEFAGNGSRYTLTYETINLGNVSLPYAST